MSDHALLSPSGASRWIACTPSAKLEQGFADSSGEAAREGTLAHKLGETILRIINKDITKGVYNKSIISIEKDPLYDRNMREHSENYAAYVIERLLNAQLITPDARLYLETKFDLTMYAPESFGTGDATIIADDVIEIIDLKYGKGVSVYAENNAQMMLYALGALEVFSLLYAPKRVRMTIYQPRLDNISTWEISVNDLWAWAEITLKPRAQLAFNGAGDYVPGKHCRFCRAKAVCRANADYNLQMAQYEFRDAEILSSEEISAILDREDEFTKWLSGVKAYALSEAVNNHKKFPGYKIVEGRSNRKFSSETAVVAKLLEAGMPVDKIYKPPVVIGVTEMEKMMGKGAFNAIIGPLITKAPGAPTLVPAADKRPEYSSAESAVKAFEDIEIED